jgi:hypothetical protein
MTWKFGGAPIPAIFVSYPNPKLKSFQKEYTTKWTIGDVVDNLYKLKHPHSALISA